MNSISYGLNDALDITTFTASNLEHNYSVRKISRPCIFINKIREIAPYNHDGMVMYKDLAIKDSSL